MATLKKTSTLRPTTSSASDSAGTDSDSHVDFNTEDLVGCQVSSPIFDKSGLLLLAKGAG